MSGMWFLMGLLLLAYLGSFLFGGHVIRGFGSASGVEYLLLGFVLGPHVLGLIERRTVTTFEPLAEVTVGWVALIVGLSFGFLGGRRVRGASMVGGSLFSLLTSAFIGLIGYVVLTRLTFLRGRDAALCAAGVGIACAETTRHSVRWVVERYSATGPLSELIGELTDCDDGVPLVATAVVFAFASTPHGVAGVLPPLAWAGLTPLIGVLLGLAASVLLGKDFRLDESWGVLLGTSVLTVGLAARLQLSIVTATFALGLTIANASRHRDEITAMVFPTERPALMPALVLAGARINLEGVPRLGFFVAAVVVARIVAKYLVGASLRAMSATARRGGGGLGFGLLSSGGVSMCIGLVFALRFPGPLGDAVLVAAATVALVGEFLGPPALRAALRASGDIAPGAIRTPMPFLRHSPPPEPIDDEGSESHR